MLYFAYGRNLNPERNRGWKYVGKAKLRGYSWMINERGVSTVVSSEDWDSVVWGGMFELTSEDLDVLDRHEGYPAYYDRTVMDLEPSGGDVVKAWVYTDKLSSLPGKPRAGYIEAIVVELEFYGFDSAWIERVRAHAVSVGALSIQK